MQDLLILGGNYYYYKTRKNSWLLLSPWPGKFIRLELGAGGGRGHAMHFYLWNRREIDFL